MNSNTAMRHLLWKDFYQVRPALVGCAAMLACIQLLYFVAQLLDRGTSMSIFQGAYAVALVAPTLAAIACSGLLIGQERQTRTWNWSSSLPISWSSALASKTIVWLLGSIGLTLLLLLFYAIVYKIALLSGRTPVHQAMLQAPELRFLIAMLLLIPVEVFIVFSIAALFWNDTLLALVIAGVVVSFGHLLLVDPAARSIHGISSSEHYRPEDHIVTVALLLIGAIALAAVGLCFGFRWRWTSGQLASFSLREWLRSRVGARRSASSLAYASGSSWVAASGDVPIAWPTAMAKPNETAMMFLHAWRSGLGIRSTIFISMLALMFLAPAQWYVYPLAIMVGSLFLGATAFGSEHALGRYRFFADRGASWFRFLVAHVAVALAWLIVLLAVGCWLGNLHASAANARQPNLVVVALCTFGAAVFSSLCIANPVIATTLSCLIVFGCAICYEMGHSLWVWLTGQGGLVYAALPLTVAIVLAALLYQTRRWLILERPRSVRMLLATWLIGLFVPIWLSLTFGYLTIPAVQWRGMPEEQIHSSEPARLPRLETEMPELFTMLVKPAPSVAIPVQEQWVADGYRDHCLRIERLYGSIQAWLDAWDGSLDELGAELSDPQAFAIPDQQTVATYKQLIEELATLGVAATQAGDRERALSAWRLNHSLLKLSEKNVDLATDSLVARITTWEMWNLLSPDDLAFLQANTDVGELLPGHVVDSLWAQKLRARWSIRKLALRVGPAPGAPWAGRYDIGLPGETDPFVRSVTKYYPPLRWAVERLMAGHLAQELEMLEGQRFLVPEVPVYRAAQDDPLAYQVQMLHQLERQVTAKVARVP